MIPQDPAILLSYVNTWLRDNGGGFAELLRSHGLTEAQGAEIKERLAAIGYRWDGAQEKFV